MREKLIETVVYLLETISTYKRQLIQVDKEINKQWL